MRGRGPLRQLRPLDLAGGGEGQLVEDLDGGTLYVAMATAAYVRCVAMSYDHTAPTGTQGLHAGGGPDAERTATVRHFSRLFVTGAQLRVPLVSLVPHVAVNAAATGARVEPPIMAIAPSPAGVGGQPRSPQPPEGRRPVST